MNEHTSCSLPAFIRRGLSVHENAHLGKATIGIHLSSTALPASDTRTYIYHEALYARTHQDNILSVYHTENTTHGTGLVILEQGEAPEVVSLHIPEYIAVPLNT